MRLQDYAPRAAHLKWLLDSDPAIRWQVMRDLTGEPPEGIAAERSRIATERWGAQLLARQSAAGKWSGSPRGWRDDLPKEHRELIITLYSLVALMDLGLDPASQQARTMINRVDQGVVFGWLNNRPYLHGETEPCINGRILGIASYFKEPNDALAKQQSVLPRSQRCVGGILMNRRRILCLAFLFICTMIGQSFGLGFAVRTSLRQSPVSGSVGDYFWAGAAGTYFWADPQEKMYGVMMLQTPFTEAGPYRRGLREIVYGSLLH